MWVSKDVWTMVTEQNKANDAHMKQNIADLSEVLGENNRLKTENARLRADLDWFKLRLNSVERERAQLIFAAVGTKISVPEFVPTYDAPETALGEQPDFAAVGEDARSNADYSALPERANN